MRGRTLQKSNHRDTEYTEGRTQRRVPKGSLVPPGTRTRSAVVSKRNWLQEPVLVTRLSLSPITLRVQPGSGAYRREWTLSASDWFAQAGSPRAEGLYFDGTPCVQGDGQAFL